MPAPPAVPIPDSGPDEAPIGERSPLRWRRRRLGLRRPAGDAVRTLHLLLIGSILAPLLVLLGGGYLAYERVFAQARADLAQVDAVAEENLIKALDTHELLAARGRDLVAGPGDGGFRARGKEVP